MTSKIVEIINKWSTIGDKQAEAALDRHTAKQTRLANQATNTGRAFSAQQQGLGGLVAGYAAAAATIFAVSAAFTALNKAAQFDQVIAGTRILGSEIGKSGDEIVATVQRITKSQLSLVDTATQVNGALSAGFSTDQIERLSEVALKASRALGRNLPDSFNRIIRGSAKMEAELLDELGIFTRIEPAVNKYAASVGKSTTSLTNLERRMAFTNSVIEEGERKFNSINTSIPTTSEQLERFASTMQNLATRLGSFIAKTLTPVFEFFSGNATAAISAFGLLVALVMGKTASIISDTLENKAQKSIQIFADKWTNRLTDLLRFFDKDVVTGLDKLGGEFAKLGDKASTAELGKVVGKGLSADLKASLIEFEKITKANELNYAQAIRYKEALVQTRSEIKKNVTALEEQQKKREAKATDKTTGTLDKSKLPKIYDSTDKSIAAMNEQVDFASKKIQILNGAQSSAANSAARLSVAIRTVGNVAVTTANFVGKAVSALSGFLVFISIAQIVGSLVLKLLDLEEEFDNVITSLGNFFGIIDHRQGNAKEALDGITRAAVEAASALNNVKIPEKFQVTDTQDKIFGVIPNVRDIKNAEQMLGFVKDLRRELGKGETEGDLLARFKDVDLSVLKTLIQGAKDANEATKTLSEDGLASVNAASTKLGGNITSLYNNFKITQNEGIAPLQKELGKLNKQIDDISGIEWAFSFTIASAKYLYYTRQREKIQERMNALGQEEVKFTSKLNDEVVFTLINEQKIADLKRLNTKASLAQADSLERVNAIVTNSIGLYSTTADIQKSLEAGSISEEAAAKNLVSIRSQIAEIEKQQAEAKRTNDADAQVAAAGELSRTRAITDEVKQQLEYAISASQYRTKIAKNFSSELKTAERFGTLLVQNNEIAKSEAELRGQEFIDMSNQVVQNNKLLKIRKESQKYLTGEIATAEDLTKAYMAQGYTRQQSLNIIAKLDTLEQQNQITAQAQLGSLIQIREEQEKIRKEVEKQSLALRQQLSDLNVGQLKRNLDFLIQSEDKRIEAARKRLDFVKSIRDIELETAQIKIDVEFTSTQLKFDAIKNLISSDRTVTLIIKAQELDHLIEVTKQQIKALDQQQQHDLDMIKLEEDKFANEQKNTIEQAAIVKNKALADAEFLKESYKLQNEDLAQRVKILNDQITAFKQVFADAVNGMAQVLAADRAQRLIDQNSGDVVGTAQSLGINTTQPVLLNREELTKQAIPLLQQQLGKLIPSQAEIDKKIQELMQKPLREEDLRRAIIDSFIKQSTEAVQKLFGDVTKVTVGMGNIIGLQGKIVSAQQEAALDEYNNIVKLSKVDAEYFKQATQNNKALIAATTQARKEELSVKITGAENDLKFIRDLTEKKSEQFSAEFANVTWLGKQIESWTKFSERTQERQDTVTQIDEAMAIAGTKISEAFIEYLRVSDLFKQGKASQSDVDQAKVQLEAARTAGDVFNKEGNKAKGKLAGQQAADGMKQIADTFFLGPQQKKIEKLTKAKEAIAARVEIQEARLAKTREALTAATRKQAEAFKQINQLVAARTKAEKEYGKALRGGASGFGNLLSNRDSIISNISEQSNAIRDFATSTDQKLFLDKSVRGQEKDLRDSKRELRDTAIALAAAEAKLAKMQKILSAAMELTSNNMGDFAKNITGAFDGIFKGIMGGAQNLLGSLFGGGGGGGEGGAAGGGGMFGGMVKMAEGLVKKIPVIGQYLGVALKVVGVIVKLFSKAPKAVGTATLKAGESTAGTNVSFLRKFSEQEGNKIVGIAGDALNSIADQLIQQGIKIGSDLSSNITQKGESIREIGLSIDGKQVANLKKRLPKGEEGAKMAAEYVIEEFFKNVTKLTASNPTVQAALDNFVKQSDRNQDMFNRFVEFANSFDETISNMQPTVKSTNQLLSDIAINSKLFAAATAANLQDFLQKTKEVFGELSAQAAQAAEVAKQYSLSLLGLTQISATQIVLSSKVADTTSVLQLQLAQLKADFQNLGSVLSAAGYSATDISKILSEGFSMRRAEIIKDFVDNFNIAAATVGKAGVEILDTVEEMYQGQKQRTMDIKALVAEDSQYADLLVKNAQLIKDERLQLVKSATDEELQILIDFGDALFSATARVEKATRALDSLDVQIADMLTSAFNSASDKLSQTAADGYAQRLAEIQQQLLGLSGMDDSAQKYVEIGRLLSEQAEIQGKLAEDAANASSASFDQLKAIAEAAGYDIDKLKLGQTDVQKFQELIAKWQEAGTELAAAKVALVDIEGNPLPDNTITATIAVSGITNSPATTPTPVTPPPVVTPAEKVLTKSEQKTIASLEKDIAGLRKDIAGGVSADKEAKKLAKIAEKQAEIDRIKGIVSTTAQTVAAAVAPVTAAASTYAPTSMAGMTMIQTPYGPVAIPSDIYSGLPGFAGGGKIDNMLIRATPGEYMMNRRAVNMIGEETLGHMNRHGRVPKRDKEERDHGIEVHMHNEGTQQHIKDVKMTRDEHGKMILRVITEDMRNNGPLTQTIKKLSRG